MSTYVGIIGLKHGPEAVLSNRRSKQSSVSLPSSRVSRSACEKMLRRQKGRVRVVMLVRVLRGESSRGISGCSVLCSTCLHAQLFPQMRSTCHERSLLIRRLRKWSIRLCEITIIRISAGKKSTFEPLSARSSRSVVFQNLVCPSIHYRPCNPHVPTHLLQYRLFLDLIECIGRWTIMSTALSDLNVLLAQPCPSAVIWATFVVPFVIAYLVHLPNTRVIRIGLYPLAVGCMAWGIATIQSGRGMSGFSCEILGSRIRNESILCHSFSELTVIP